MDLKKIAQELNLLQSQENDGRGVSCIRTIVSCLEQEDLDHAIAAYNVDGDKVANYPKCEKFICESLGIEPRYGELSRKNWLEIT
jgi:hypothetical protein